MVQRTMNKFLISRRDLERPVGLLSFTLIMNISKRPWFQRLQGNLKNYSRKNLRDLKVPMSPSLHRVLKKWAKL